MDMTQARHAAGLLTDREAAKLSGIPLWKIRREVTLGNFGFNRDGRGTLLVFTNDVLCQSRATLAGVPDSNKGWFDETHDLDARAFARGITGSVANAFTQRHKATGLTKGQLMLRTEARHFAKWSLRHGKHGLPAARPTLENLYNCGPDNWRKFATACAIRLGKTSFQHAGEFRSLATCIRSTGSLQLHINQAIQGAF
jgi:hypothetical protein